MKKRLPFLGFLAFYLVFSLATFRDYGCTWDEPDTYLLGNQLYQFLIHGKPMTYLDPEHGYPYTFLLSFFTGPTNYEVLHLLNLLFAIFLFWGIYEVLLSQYGKPRWALSGPVFLFLFLPFLGSIPANPKDVPFAIFYFLSLAVLYLYERLFPQSRFRWFFFGLLAGFTVSSRIVGFTLFPLLLFYDAYLFFMGKGKKRKREIITWLKRRGPEWAGSFVVSQILCALLWPFIGMDYFHNLPAVFWLSSHFPMQTVFLFFGHATDAMNYPWYYLPAMMVLTTPLFILFYFLGSAWLYPKARTNPLYALVGAAFLLNLALYFLLHPAVYDGLRHFLYLLPLMAVLASLTFIEFFQKARWILARKMVVGLTLIGILLTTKDLVGLHPYEYTYFNEVIGGLKGASGNFETDYWVASFKEAVEWLRNHEFKEPGRKYRVFAVGNPPQTHIYTGDSWEFVTDKKSADYEIIMTRAGIKPEPGEESKVIHPVEREGAPLCYILKLR